MNDRDDSHSPFRQHKTRDKHEIDRMTLTMSVEMPDSFSLELRSLLTGLLQRDVHKRLGCRGRGADEIKSHPFFRGIDWRVVFLQRLPPPLIPARGEVNAADAFDIGSFDDEDTKHIRLSEADQELYRNFPVVVSERWQHEIAETIFDYINHEADKAEMKRKNKHKLGYQEEEQSDCILHGYIKRLGGTFTATWLTRYVRLYPNRLELWSDSGKQPELIFMDQIEEVCNDYVQIKNEQCIVIKLYNHSKYVFTNSDEIGLKEWHVSLKAAHKDSLDMMTTMAEKATKIYGTEIPLKHMGKRRQQLQLEANSNSTTASIAPNSNSAIANLEQKIIQKELQASSRSPEVPATAAQPAPPAAAAASLKQQQHTPMKGLENICPAAARAAARSQVAPPVAGQQQQQVVLAPQQHKYHRGHHQHRTHQHRHHHHAKHGGGQVVGGPWPGHHHHRHASSSGRHLPAASAARGHLPPPCQAAVHQKPPASAEEELDASISKNNDGGGGEQSSATVGQPAEKQIAEAAPSGEEGAPLATKLEEPGDKQTTVKDEPKEEQVAEKKVEQQSNSIDSSSSGRSGSCSSSSEASGEEAALPEEEEEEVDEIQKAQVSLQVTTASVDQQQAVAAAVATGEPAPEPEPEEKEASKPRLALSLENVGEHQEVLRDPSKRITSDNKQREQDLVAQYEKLNIGARNSSSSIEEEPQAAAKSSI